MAKKTQSTPHKTPRREESLSRERIIEASIELLDTLGEGGLTFRALSERLATGPGAIYGHIEHKSDLLNAACDAIVARTLSACVTGATPAASIRSLALGMFDAIDAHPWVGSALAQAAGQLHIVRILERLGRQVCALGVVEGEQRAAVSALLSYILGVAGQNAANGQLARTKGIDRADFLEALSNVWLQLDPDEFAFTRSIAVQMRAHDDRADFLAGIDLILSGLASKNPGKKGKN